MRITQGILRDRAVADLQRVTTQFAALQRQSATGERFEFASEDPLHAGDVVAATRALSELEQAGRAQSAARTRLETEDQVLSAISDLLGRAKELAVAQSDGTSSIATREIARIEADQILSQIAAMGNTRVGSEFIFAGEAAGSPAFQGTTYVGGALPRQVEILPGQRITTSQTGQTLFQSSGVLTAIEGLRDALATGNAGPVLSSIQAIDDAAAATETNLADSGARLRRLESAETARADQEALLLTRRERSGGVDLTEVVAKFVATESALQTSAAALNRVLTLNLVQFLR